MDKERFQELEQASKPLVEFLHKYYNMNTIAIVRDGHVDILSEEMGLPLEPKNNKKQLYNILGIDQLANLKIKNVERLTKLYEDDEKAEYQIEFDGYEDSIVVKNLRLRKPNKCGQLGLSTE